MSATPSLLVVAGELSGDLMAADVVRRLSLAAFGLGGSALRAAGAEVLVDVATFANMGFNPPLVRLGRLGLAARRLERALLTRRPRVALLTGFSEFNAWLAPRLRRRGVRVLWYAPPQIWAWRLGRGARLSRACDALAVTLPFEAAIWQRFGAQVHYVGHPACDRISPDRAAARELLGMHAGARALALLPGSREHEIRRLLPLLLGAAQRLRSRAGVQASVLRAPGLEPKLQHWFEAACRRAEVALLDVPAARALAAFDAALCCSGTATLECVLARVPPVIVYKTDAITAWLARRALLVPHIGLPNLLLGERAFPELVQGAASVAATSAACWSLLNRRDALAVCCDRVRELLTPDARAPSAAERVAALVVELGLAHEQR